MASYNCHKRTTLYPYVFPDSFLIYQSKYDMRVKLEIIESIYQQSSIKKIFYLEDFLKQFSSQNYQKQMKVKKIILQQFEILQNHNLIEDNFQFLGKDGFIEQIKGKQFTTTLLTKSKYIYFV